MPGGCTLLEHRPLNWIGRGSEANVGEGKVGGEGSRHQINRAVVETPFCAGREPENLKMARLKCCILLLLQATAGSASLCVCVAQGCGSSSCSDCIAG